MAMCRPIRSFTHATTIARWTEVGECFKREFFNMIFVHLHTGWLFSVLETGGEERALFLLLVAVKCER